MTRKSEAAEAERKTRVAALHRWVAEGKVEYKIVSIGAVIVIEYCVAGGAKWYRDDTRHGPWPSTWLIANLGLGLAVLNPEAKPIKPQWQHAYGVGRTGMYRNDGTRDGV